MIQLLSVITIGVIGGIILTVILMNWYNPH